jgi:hypothetical protein
MFETLSSQSLSRNLSTFQPVDHSLASSSSFQRQLDQEPGQHALHLARGWTILPTNMLLWSLRLRSNVLFVDDRGLHSPWRG